ncbi:unnamed protein product [Dicrocoelium dendriticum]|nr:unnamed protein product [Dicrocoelium dendriticum]
MSKVDNIEEVDKESIDYSTCKPRDRLYIVYIIFFIAGVGTLLPWNFFITATDYFNLRLASNSSGRAPGLLPFDNSLTLCSMIPLSVFGILNFALMRWIPTFTRFLIGSIIVFAMFVVTTVMVRIDMDLEVFNGLTLASIVFINIGSAIAQTALFGMVSVLPAKNMKGFVEGQAISGVLSSLARIISIAAASNWNDDALAYFLIALVFLAISIVLTLLLKKNAFFKYYWKMEKNMRQHGETTPSSSSGDMPHSSTEMVTKESDAKTILFNLGISMRETWVHGVCIIFTFGVTLTVFPPFTATVRPMNYRAGDEWTDKYFIPVVVFLSYNVFDWLGRFLAGFIKWVSWYFKCLR